MNAANVIARLAKLSRQDGDCVRWTGRIGGKGYGRITVNGKSMAVHRVAYEVLVGPIPDGLEIDHRCRVRDCINVVHLEPVTHLENVRRRRDNPDECAQGHPYTEENITWSRCQGRPNLVRKCRRCKQISNAQRGPRPMTDRDRERLAKLPLQRQAQDRGETVKSNRLAGHALPNEGKVRDAAGWLSNGPGRARCSCGIRSPKLASTAKRKVWHRDHKDDLRAGGNGVVWEGSLP